MSESVPPAPNAELDRLHAAGHRFQQRLEHDFERFRTGLPDDLTGYIRTAYNCDIRGEYAGMPLRNPFGKASGQLSLNVRQVARDAEAGLGFVVLKTVIAVDEQGGQSMAEWAIPETRMRVERITDTGTEGWTVTWKGRGWSESFAAYCDLVRQAAALSAECGMVVAPSVKYHLPPPGETGFCEGEYRYTTRALQQAWASGAPGPLPLEKDFSPTLAGDERSREREQILFWLRHVPDLIRRSAHPLTHSPTHPPSPLRVGIKLMNARFEPEFQVEMVRAVLDGPDTPPDFLVYANRLFDPDREFEGKTGVAYGGPALSARNLQCLDRIRAARAGFRRRLPPISATGDILTGRRALEYGLRGATSCQMHTLFQLPDSEFAATSRNKTTAVLHHLLFHPETGLLVWLERLRLHRDRERLDWTDLAGLEGIEGASQSGTA